MATRTQARPDLWQRVEALCRAAIRITAEHDLERVLQEITDSAREVVGARYAALGVLNESGDELVQFVASGITAEEQARIGAPPQGKGLLGLLIDDPKPIRVRDVARHPRAAGFPDHHPHMKSFLGVPILGRSEPIGNLYLTDKMDAEEFTAEDESFAVMLAAHAAVAVENARYDRERDQLLGRLRSMQVSRDRFFAMINHELRNALTAIHGWTELWIRKAGTDVPRTALEVYESAERAMALLEDVLDLSRLDASKLEPKVSDGDAWKIVRTSIAPVEPAAGRGGIRIETEGPDAPVPCRSDPQRISQILINLLTNAVRHSPPDEPVTVALEASPDTLRFHVIDRGEGIAAEHQAAIFEAFERSDSRTERGTGLGLALSRKLANLLGGDLRVESKPGAGARFTLEVPRYLESS
jgi:signal transduction histidine kinase